MAEYIDRRELFRTVEEYASTHPVMNDNELFALFSSVPKASVRPIVRGKWIRCNRGAGYKCSVCNARHSINDVFNGNHHFCYKCGAAMVKEEPILPPCEHITVATFTFTEEKPTE